uniref:HMG box domain-containing protein n=1 Tax=Phaeodactylum tricornutum TaxID=2850 RepID=A0A8J9T5N2_PHATR
MFPINPNGDATKKGKPRGRKKKPRKWTKPDGMPKRPLSAYNLFFRHERRKLLDASSPSIEDNEETNAIVAESKIGFAVLARTIASKWRDLEENEKIPYVQQAEIEQERYKREVEEWQRLGLDPRQKNPEASNACNAELFIDNQHNLDSYRKPNASFSVQRHTSSHKANISPFNVPQSSRTSNSSTFSLQDLVQSSATPQFWEKEGRADLPSSQNKFATSVESALFININLINFASYIKKKISLKQLNLVVMIKAYAPLQPFAASINKSPKTQKVKDTARGDNLAEGTEAFWSEATKNFALPSQVEDQKLPANDEYQTTHATQASLQQLQEKLSSEEISFLKKLG